MGSAINIANFVNRSLRSGLLGFNIAFFSFLCLIPLEFLIGVVFRSGPPPGLGPMYSVTLIISAAFIYAFVFNIVFLGSRTLGALLERLDRLWRGAVPGFVIFLILGQPASENIFAYTGAFHPAFSIPLTVLFLILSMGLAVFALYFFPIFQGLNSTFLLLAALLTRLLYLPLTPIYPGAGLFQFLLQEITLTISFAVVYALFQIRYKQHLSPLHEPYFVPRKFQIAGGLLLIPGVLCLLLAGNFPELPIFAGFYPDELIRMDQVYFLGALLFLAPLHWSFTALWLNSGYDKKNVAFRFEASGPHRVFLGFILFTLAGVLHLAENPPGTEESNYIHKRGVFSYEILLAGSILLDRDRDGNSFWPGGDPDDQNSCINRIYNSACSLAEAKPDRKLVSIKEDGKKKKGPAQINLITLSGFKWRPDLFAAQTKPNFRGVHAEVFAPSADTPDNLRGILMGLNGLELTGGKTAPSLPGIYSRRGYRSICGGYDAGENYLKPGHSARLDAGCQIFIQGEFKDDFRSTANLMMRKLKDYGEKRNFFWIHHHFQAPERVWSRLALLEGGPRTLQAVLEVAEELALTGSTYILILNESSPYIADLWIYASEDREKTPGVFKLQELVELYSRKKKRKKSEEKFPLARTGEHEYQGILHPRGAPSWVRALYRSWTKKNPPIYFRFAPSARRIQYTDGLTGASWYSSYYKPISRPPDTSAETNGDRDSDNPL